MKRLLLLCLFLATLQTRCPLLAQPNGSGVGFNSIHPDWLYGLRYGLDQGRDLLDLQKEHLFDVTAYPYLAAGNGVTDDTAAIQAAIDAAIAAGGGVVVVPSTDAYYLLDGDIDLDGAVNLVVQGLGNPRLHRSGDDEAAAAFIIDDGTGSKIVFAGLRLTSTAVYHQSAAKNAIKLVGASASDISDVTIRDCQFDGWHKGIYGANMERLIVDGCTFANLVQIDTNTNGYGVLIERVYDVKIVHNSFSGTVMRHAVYTNTNTRELLIQGNEFIGNTDAAYLPTGYEMRIKILNCDSCVIDDNVFHDGMTPIIVDGTGDSIAVTGNICDGTEGLIWVVANNTTRSILVAYNIVNADGVDAQAQYTGARGALRFQATASGSHVTVHDNIILSDDMAILADPEMTLSVVGNQLVYTGSSAPYGWALRSMTATAQITFGANTIRGYGYAMRNGVQTASGNTLVSCTGLSSNPASGSVLRGNYPDAQNVFNASISVKNGTTSAGYIDFYEDGDDGTSKVRLIGPALAGDVTLTLPATAGTNGYFLKTNGSGVLDWAAIAGGGDMLASTYDQDTNGDIDVAAGGTDKSSWTQYAIPYLSGATAFGEIGIGTAGQYLKVAAGATGYEWGTPTAGAAGSDTHVQFNDGGSALGGDAGMTYVKATDILTLTGGVSTPKLTNLTSNGFVKTGSGDGTLSVDTATYLTAESDPAVGTHESTYDHTLIATALQSETDPTALLTAGTDNVKDTHIDFGSGAGQVNADDLGDGATNAIPTLTQESHWDTAYGWGDHAGAGYLTAEVDGSTTNEIEVVDEAFSAANFNGHTTEAVSQDDFYDLWHGIDTDDDGDIDAIDATVWATKQAADADLDDLADGSLSASKVAGVADADYGDVTVSGGVWAVEDDSHSHSGYQATVTEGSLANSVILSEDIKDGEVAVADLAAAAKTACVNFVIDGGGSAIATGIKGDFVIPFACTITGIAVLGDQSGSIVIDLWQGTIAEQIAGTIVDADSITASDPPTVSSAIGVDDDTLTDWDATVNALQVIRVNVDSCTTMTRCTLVLKLSKT